MGCFLGLSSLYGREIDDVQTVPLVSISEIEAILSSTRVHIIRTEGGSEIKFHLYGSAMWELGLDIKTSSKTVIAKIKRKSLFPGLEDLHLDIYVPAEYMNAISITTSSGKITIDSFDLASIVLSTSSGGLEAENLYAGKISIDTSSGNIAVKKIETDELTVIGSSSTIAIDECETQRARIKTSSGDITLKKCDRSFDISASSGNVRLEYINFEGRFLKANTSSGCVTVYLPDNAEFLVDAKMTSGNFHSDFSIVQTKNTDKKLVYGQVGTKQNNISIETTSGNIRIVKGAMHID
jgi:lia operon protein LiaG